MFACDSTGSPHELAPQFGTRDFVLTTMPGKAYRVTCCLASNSNGRPDVKTLEVSASGQPVIAFSFDRTGHTLESPRWVRKQYRFVTIRLAGMLQ